MKRYSVALFLIFISFLLEVQVAAQTYYVYVCAESDDQVSVVKHSSRGLEIVKTVEVGSFPAETEGPHGIQISPDGQYWYVSLAHGFPYGSVHKYKTGSDEWVDDVKVGMYPATIDVAGSTQLLYVVNLNLHGPLEPTDISVIETDTMTEVARVSSGVRPHGGRLSQDETAFYSVNMMDSELVETDALGFEVLRRLFLGQNVQPSWVTRPTRNGTVFITGNNVSKIFEVDLKVWKISRIFDAPGGPYNAAVTPDGMTLVVTYKEGNAVGFWDVPSGRERSRVSTTGTIPHGVALSPDGHYAFVTNEGVGDDPGVVEAYMIHDAQRVGSVNVGKQAGGIAFWKLEN